MIVGTSTVLRNNTARAPVPFTKCPLMVTCKIRVQNHNSDIAILQKAWVLLFTAGWGWEFWPHPMSSPLTPWRGFVISPRTMMSHISTQPLWHLLSVGFGCLVTAWWG